MVLVPVPVPHKLELGTDSGLVLEKKKKIMVRALVPILKIRLNSGYHKPELMSTIVPLPVPKSDLFQFVTQIKSSNLPNRVPTQDWL